MSDLRYLQRFLSRVKSLHASQMQAYTEARDTPAAADTIERADRTQVRIWQIERRISILEGEANSNF